MLFGHLDPTTKTFVVRCCLLNDPSTTHLAWCTCLCARINDGLPSGLPSAISWVTGVVWTCSSPGAPKLVKVQWGALEAFQVAAHEPGFLEELGLMRSLSILPSFPC